MFLVAQLTMGIGHAKAVHHPLLCSSSAELEEDCCFGNGPLTSTEMSCRFSLAPEKYSLPYSTRDFFYEQAESYESREEEGAMPVSLSELMAGAPQVQERKRHEDNVSPQALLVEEVRPGAARPRTTHNSPNALTTMPVSAAAAMLVPTPQSPTGSSQSRPASPGSSLKKPCSPKALVVSCDAGCACPVADGAMCNSGSSRGCGGTSEPAPPPSRHHHAQLHWSFFGPTPDESRCLGRGRRTTLPAEQRDTIHFGELSFVSSTCTSQSCLPKPALGNCNSSAVTEPLFLREEYMLNQRMHDLRVSSPSRP